ncbi:flavodoxin family protein [Methanobrevibacter sp.]|uniref:flavodoxin family protein n=1 Tax=Methanobrevibacter sp. TaxID=66852 RepID=UPI00386F0623
MKILIVYYSRTDVTKGIANKIQSILNCDIEEITDDGKYDGKLGFLKGGMNATMGRASDINPISKDPADYDLVIVGTPVWSSNMATPIFTYLIQNKDKINKMASFCTCMGGGYDKALEKMAEVSGKQQISTMFLTSKDIDNPSEKIDTFINEIK